MGLLDLFDSPDILASILGAQNPGVTPSGSFTPAGYTGSTGAPAAPAPQGPPPPQVGADWSSYPNIAGAQDPNRAQPYAPSPTPAAPPPAAAAAGAPAPVNMGPLPLDAFGSMADGSTGNTAQLVTPPPGMATRPAPQPGAPMNILPPPASTGALPPSGPALPRSVFGLDSILGATQLTPGQNALLAGMAGLGKGLSAVGAQRPGATGAASFAAGMGGALEGGVGQIDRQEQQRRQTRMDLFNASSTAFRNMLAAQSQDDMEGYRRAQGNYLNARAAAMRLGGTGSGAWQTTPYGKTIGIENEAQKYEKGQQILLQKRWTLNGATPDQQQKDLDDLAKRVDDYRKGLYKSAGIDPGEGSKMKDWGVSSDNPFPTKGMTLQQFNEQVPMGAWYTDQNGTVRQRTVPPPGMNPSPPLSPEQQAELSANGRVRVDAPIPQAPAVNYDDMQAMAPAA